ncbi:MAG: MBL fold metallo-hydrolase [Chlamydiota bacterium]
MKLLFLGSGGSMGIPVIGCSCFVCTSDSSFNSRLRPSVLITHKKKRYLIDIGPDYRTQALGHGIDHLDGLLLTHTHYDHIGGLDELRTYTSVQKKSLPCLLSKETLEELKIRYHYLFSPTGSDAVRSAILKFRILEGSRGKIDFEGLTVTYISYDQLGMKVNGFSFGSCAYVTDILDYKEDIFATLRGIDTLIISGRRWKRSKSHLGLEEAVKFSEKTGAKKTYFTHICHEMDHDETNRQLPKGFSLAHDGLELTL